MMVAAPMELIKPAILPRMLHGSPDLDAKTTATKGKNST
jgi:hypothetical protein